MKRQFAVVGVALFLLMGLLVACGGGDAQEAQPAATATSAPATATACGCDDQYAHEFT